MHVCFFYIFLFLSVYWYEYIWGFHKLILSIFHSCIIIYFISRPLLETRVFLVCWIPFEAPDLLPQFSVCALALGTSFALWWFLWLLSSFTLFIKIPLPSSLPEYDAISHSLLPLHSQRQTPAHLTDCLWYTWIITSCFPICLM